MNVIAVGAIFTSIVVISSLYFGYYNVTIFAGGLLGTLVSIMTFMGCFAIKEIN